MVWSILAIDMIMKLIMVLGIKLILKNMVPMRWSRLWDVEGTIFLFP